MTDKREDPRRVTKDVMGTEFASRSSNAMTDPQHPEYYIYEETLINICNRYGIRVFRHMKPKLNRSPRGRGLPSGIFRSPKKSDGTFSGYESRYSGIYLGLFKTVEEAIRARKRFRDADLRRRLSDILGLDHPDIKELMSYGTTTSGNAS